MKHFYLLLLICLGLVVKAQNAGIYQSYVIINNVYYDCQGATQNPDFQMANLGSFREGTPLVLNGGEIKTWKNNGGDVKGGSMFYRVYKQGEIAGGFTEVAFSWKENNVDGNVNNQKWDNTTVAVNLLSSLPKGTYTLEVYFKIKTHATDVYDSNNSQNYVANFSILADELPVRTDEIRQGAVRISPAFPKKNDEITLTFDATGTALQNVQKVYLHSGVATDKPESHAFSIVKGNWGADDTIGEMIRTDEGLWQIKFDIVSYYNLQANDNAFALNLLFRDVTGALKEDNQGVNYHFKTNPENYFLLENPLNAVNIYQKNTSFLVKATSNVAVSWFLEEITNGTSTVINITENKQNYEFSQSVTTTDVLHRYKLVAKYDQGEVEEKFFSVQGYSQPVEEKLAEGFKKGVNYDFPQKGEITLVLHTPTSTTYTYYDSNNCSAESTIATLPKQSVHLLADFNNWQVSDEYLLKKDGDYWWITLEVTDLPQGQNAWVYQFLVDGNLQIADPYTHQVSDPDDAYISSSVYAALPAYPTGKAVGRAAVLHINKEPYVWQVPNFERVKERNELIVYELHFRDFTSEGTYCAATEKLDYLQQLGINCIHVMPISEFEGNDSWGYNPNFYFAVDKAYGTENELKKFIDEAHKRGIAVVNDLVLNHAFYSNPNVMLYWNSKDNRPADDNSWFNPTHKAIAEPSGHWGADWNHASEHTRQMVNDIITYWMHEFKFDGFRFDFTKGFSQKDPNPADPWASSYDQCRIEILKNMAQMVWANHNGTGKQPYVIFEHLANDAEDRTLADFGILLWSGAGVQKPYMELAMGHMPMSIWNSVYAARGFSYANFMSYMESHDEERIAFKVKTYGKGATTTTKSYTKYLSERIKLVSAFNLLLPGPRMVWQFGELGYDVAINENGRTGKKPSAWLLNYDKDENRQEIRNLFALIFSLRNQYNLFERIDYGNIGSQTDWHKKLSVTDATKGVQVIAVGNFNTEEAQTIQPNYFKTGTWFKYTGNPLTDGEPFMVKATDDSFTLHPDNPVFLLTNFDNVPPKITPWQIELQTDKAEGVVLSANYDCKKEEFSTLDTVPKKGFASDNSNDIKLKISKINNVSFENIFSLEGKTFTEGQHFVTWEVEDNFGNKAEAVQTIIVKYVPAVEESVETPVPTTGFEGDEHVVGEGEVADNHSVSLEIYNAISANGDDLNSTFIVGGIEAYPQNKMRIFNALGHEVFNVMGYNNTSVAFKGYTHNAFLMKDGEKLMPGVYFFNLEYIDKIGEKKEVLGFIYLSDKK